MDLKERIESFSELGLRLRNSLASNGESQNNSLAELIKNQWMKNAWFTPDNVTEAIRAIASELTPDMLAEWTDRYPGLHYNEKPYNAAVIMAGNIPLVGFHDFLCVLITGNRILAKTSSKDSELIVHIGDILCSINHGFRELISFTEGRLSSFDAVIATGSNNSSRYFESYFGKYPNIIRKNRNSIAILDGSESDTECIDLAADIFSYFGLGCRNVSKLYIPVGYDLTILLKLWEGFSSIINNNKYANNYDFNKAVYLVNSEKFLDTGYLLLKEEKGLSSPVAVLYYEYYNSYESLMQNIDLLNDKIQCIVSKWGIPFGKAQSPHLWDYADGIDTIDFLLKKNQPEYCNLKNIILHPSNSKNYGLQICSVNG